jgi:hypothetical protein
VVSAGQGGPGDALKATLADGTLDVTVARQARLL